MPPMPSDDPLRLAILIGSTRVGRFAPTVARWFEEQAATHGGFELDVVDLLDLELPPHLTREREGPLQAFADRIERADAYVVVTPEYNHGYPAALKHAIDLCHAEWRRKAVGFVSYGGVSGGLRAVEQLRQVFAELHVASVRDSVSFHLVGTRFDEHGRPHDPDGPALAATVLLDELAWWADALRTARHHDDTAEAAPTPATAA